MSDYIDKWELIEKMEWDNDIQKWTIWEDVLKSIPSADVAPVRHGYWYDIGSLSCRCSECGCKSNKETAYCPSCGAKMDE